jgi:hypothetical protein
MKKRRYIKRLLWAPGICSGGVADCGLGRDGGLGIALSVWLGGIVNDPVATQTYPAMSVFQDLYWAPAVGTSIFVHLEPRNSYNPWERYFERPQYMSG